MSRRAWASGLVLAAILWLLVAAGFIAGRATAIAPSSWRPLPPSAFTPVATPRPAPLATPAVEPSPMSRTRATRTGAPLDPPARGQVHHAAAPALSGAPLTGIASWFDNGPGLYAAVPGWRWGDTPYRVRVCANPTPISRGLALACVVVTVSDCLCGRSDRLIDLSAMAFSRLAPLSAGLLRGLIRVTVRRLP